jgi:hypothetical protein
MLFGLPQMTIEAVSAIIVAGGQAQIRLNMEVDIKILISILIYRIN